MNWNWLAFAVMIMATVASSAIEARPAVSLAANIHDQFKFIPTGRPPHVPTTSTVVRNQPFGLYLFVMRPSIKSGEADVSWSALLRKPDGSTVELSKDIIGVRGKCRSNEFFCSQSYFTVTLDEDEPLGDYTLEVVVHDRNEPKAIERSIKFRLSEPAYDSGTMTSSELSRYLMTYYREPHPERFFAALRGFFALEPELRRKRNAFPELFLSGFAAILRNNPQLREPLVEMAAALEEDVFKQYVALLLNAAGVDPDKEKKLKIDPVTRLFLEKVGNENPLNPVATVKEPRDLDLLWMEFFTGGRREPLLKIVNELKRREIMTAEQVRERGNELTAEERRKFGNFLLTAAAFRSLTANAASHPLVFFYLEGMLSRRELADPAATALVRSALAKAGERSRIRQQKNSAAVKTEALKISEEGK